MDFQDWVAYCRSGYITMRKHNSQIPSDVLEDMKNTLIKSKVHLIPYSDYTHVHKDKKYVLVEDSFYEWLPQFNQDGYWNHAFHVTKAPFNIEQVKMQAWN